MMRSVDLCKGVKVGRAKGGMVAVVLCEVAG